MSDNSDDDARVVAAEIVRYLQSHSEAADTIEGVARWWLSRQRYEEAIATVERAMSVLTNEHMVEKHTLPDGTAVYKGGPRLGMSDTSDPDKARRAMD